MIVEGDNAEERIAQALDGIEIVSLKERPKFYIISMGCAETSLT